MPEKTLNPPVRLPIVGVIGSGNENHELLAFGLGKLLATMNVHLITGGGSGVMESVSHAFYTTQPRDGSIIGILPSDTNDRLCRPKTAYPNEWIEIPIRTHLPLSGSRGTELMSRNHIIILSSDTVISLPGGEGTRSEINLAIQYHRPILAYTRDLEGDVELPENISKVSDLDGVRRFLSENLRLVSSKKGDKKD